MKLLVIFCAIFSLVTATEFVTKTAEDLALYRRECVQEASVPSNLVEEYKKWIFSDDEITKCYIRCIFKKMELFVDDTGPVVPNLLKQLKNGGTTDLQSEIEQCVDNNPDKDDNCTWAYRGFKCFNEKHLDLIKSSIHKTD